MSRNQKVLGIVISAVLAILALYGWYLPIELPEPPVVVPRGVSNLDSLELATDLDVGGTSELDGGLTVDDTAFIVANTTGNTTVAGTLGVTGAATFAGLADVGTWANLSAQTTLAIAANVPITPTGTYQPITSTAAITCSTSCCVISGTRTGDILILRNANASNAIKIDGTGGNVECKSDVTLGAGDILWLIWNGTDWNCLSGYDNS